MKEAVSVYETSTAIVTATLWVCSTFRLASKLNKEGDMKLISILLFLHKWKQVVVLRATMQAALKIKFSAWWKPLKYYTMAIS
jgi:hypothetical protein